MPAKGLSEPCPSHTNIRQSRAEAITPELLGFAIDCIRQ
jgi:hypothetical protein